MSYPCSVFKTAQITLTPPAIAPVNGYKVKWRVIGDSTWTILPNQFTNPINIVGVPSCYNIEVSIQADCDGGAGTEIIVPVSGATITCYSFVLNDVGMYTYTPCGTTTPVVISITGGMTTLEKTVCAVDNTVIPMTPGLTFTKGALCVA